jgi:hypothetical protein
MYESWKAEDGDSMFIQNVGCLHTSPHGGKTQNIVRSRPREGQISHEGELSLIFWANAVVDVKLTSLSCGLFMAGLDGFLMPLQLLHHSSSLLRTVFLKLVLLSSVCADRRGSSASFIFRRLKVSYLRGHMPWFVWGLSQLLHGNNVSSICCWVLLILQMLISHVAQNKGCGTVDFGAVGEFRDLRPSPSSSV